MLSDNKIHFLSALLVIITFILFFYNDELIGCFVFLLCGICFLSGGFYLRKRNRRIETNGVKAKAKIIDFEEKQMKDADGASYLYHFPIVTFTDRNGIETTQMLDSSENPKRINELIDIIYVKKGSEYEIIKDNDWWEKNLPLILLIIGTLSFGIGIILLRNNI